MHLKIRGLFRTEDIFRQPPSRLSTGHGNTYHVLGFQLFWARDPRLGTAQAASSLQMRFLDARHRRGCPRRPHACDYQSQSKLGKQDVHQSIQPKHLSTWNGVWLRFYLLSFQIRLLYSLEWCEADMGGLVGAFFFFFRSPSFLALIHVLVGGLSVLGALVREGATGVLNIFLFGLLFCRHINTFFRSC